MFLSQAVKGFLLDRDGENADELSPKTLNLYRNCLALLTEYLGDPDVAAIDEAQLTQFMNYLEKDYQPRRETITG